MSEESTNEPVGAKAVRAFLIEPLEANGFVRPKGRTVDEHKAFLTKLAAKLNYCDPETLQRLRPIVESLGEGKAANVWPSLATIRNYAASMQPPPDNSDAVLHGWLHSRAGERARRRGILLATRAYIKKFRRPPVTDGRADNYVEKKLAEHQREIDLDIEGIRQRIAMGEATPRETAWLEQQEACLEALEAIVADGVRHRDEKRQDGEVEAAS